MSTDETTPREVTSNPASRVLRVIQVFETASQQESMRNIWIAYLGIPPSARQEHDVVVAVNKFVGEIHLTADRLSEVGVPEHLYVNTQARLAEAFSTVQINSGLNNHIKTLNRERIVAEWEAWALSRFDEAELGDETIAALKEMLQQHEALLAGSTIPAEVRSMLSAHARELREALLLHKVQGRTAVDAAISKIEGDLRKVPPDIAAQTEASADGQKVVRSTANLIKKANEAIKQATEFFQFGKQVYQLGADAWEVVKPMITNQ